MSCYTAGSGDVLYDKTCERRAITPRKMSDHTQDTCEAHVDAANDETGSPAIRKLTH